MNNNNLVGKVFEDNSGSVVEVQNVEGNIAHLNSGQRIAVERLLDNSYYNEYVDPSNFSNRESNFYSFLGEQIRGIDTNNVGDLDGGTKINTNNAPVVESHESAQASLRGDITPSSGEYEDIERRKQEIAQNAANISKNLSNNKLKELAGEDETGDDSDTYKVNRNLEGVTVEGSTKPVQETDPRETSVTMYDENNQVNQTTTNYPPQDPQSERVVKKEDPIYQMFSQVKRSTNFSLNVKLNEKIPRKDFLKMWEESYEVSIIDFLVDEFTNKLLNDPTMIRDQLTEALKEHVYGKKTTKKKTRSKTKKTTKTTKSKSTPKKKEESDTEKD